ncbi:NTP transferase domain-containing protein [Myxococcus sp. K15C18031901]|uniref:nucleotidyltransferase family protein n=1 Tax=Myxococcus dinghuensis TaxID=2906761 RepID=UPI0020A79E62|nr:NTP transferase domain-containing protein [Myxococcus dinghuensis]MCP3105182.1 NTP transferase domain-containing protein [Myxococcus dinghuensis]
MKAVAIILASGEARRMAHPKALILHEGDKSFLQSLASTFGKANSQVLGVVGKDSEAVREQHPGLDLVEAERWRDSQMASVKVGLDAAMEAGADVVLLHPVDMPALRATTVKSLLKLMSDSDEVLRPEFDGAPGWPVMLSRAAVEKLRGADMEQLEAALKGMRVRRVPMKDPGVIVNINTPDTYERLFGTQPKLAPPPKRRGGKRGGLTTVADMSGGGSSAPMAAASDE